VHIPPFFDVRGRLPPAIARARDELGLTEADMELQGRMPDELVAALHEWGVEVLDLRDHAPPDPSAYYWSDMHLNVHGNRWVAACLVPRLEERLAMRRGVAGGR
jgi:hypothetical protein